MAGEAHEIVAIQDARSLCEGYARGLLRSSGDIVAFSHDDIEFLGPNVAQRLKAHMEKYDVVGVAGTDKLVGPIWAGAGHPHIFGQVAHPISGGRQLQIAIFSTPRRVVDGMMALDGLFLAFRRPTIEALGWDANTFDGFHCYDVDVTFRAHLAGYRVAVVNDLPVIHASMGNYGETWRRYATRFVQKHGPKLGSVSPRRSITGGVEVPTREAAIEVMTPKFWID